MKSEICKRANYKAKMPFDKLKSVIRSTDAHAHMQPHGNEEGKKFYSQIRTISNNRPVDSAKCLNHLTPDRLMSSWFREGCLQLL